MSLFSLLSTRGQSLLAHGGASGTAQHNLQNVNTPGFSRQRGNLEATPATIMGGQLIGRGVNLASVTQARDRFLDARMPGTFGS
jgi:flagellar hook-associated protein 1 FlgK